MPVDPTLVDPTPGPLPLYADQLTDDQLLTILVALTREYDPGTGNENWRRSGAALAGEAWARGLLNGMILADVTGKGKQHA